MDASFAPHEGYRSIQGAVIEANGFLFWESSRQPFITQSTAESELLAMMEGFQAQQSTISLLEAIGFQIKAKLREVLAEEKGPWKAHHCPVDLLRME